MSKNICFNNQMPSIDIYRFFFIQRNYFLCRNNAIINQMKLEHYPVICDIVNKYTSKWFDEALIIINCCTLKLNKKVSKKDKKNRSDIIHNICHMFKFVGCWIWYYCCKKKKNVYLAQNMQPNYYYFYLNHLYQ